MCGRFTLTVDPKALMEHFDLKAADFAPQTRYNVAPTQTVAVVYDESPEVLASAQWGLIPSWSKDPSIGSRMINARAETLLEKPSFRNLVKKRRCLVLADSLYEWRTNEDGSKTPMRIMLKSHEPFGFAGLWDAWKTPEGEWLKTCTIITGEPNEIVAPIHNRMAVILPHGAERDWLNHDNEIGHTMSLLKPYPASEMVAYEVSKKINSPKNDEPSVLQPV